MVLAFGLNVMELLVIFGAVILLFGAKRIPELAHSLGIAKREFQKAQEVPEKEKKEALPVAAVVPQTDIPVAAELPLVNNSFFAVAHPPEVTISVGGPVAKTDNLQ